MLVHNAKLKIQEDYARKEKEREINKRMYVSLLSCKKTVCSQWIAVFAVRGRPKLALRDERR
jgi:hypothetical protein